MLAVWVLNDLSMADGICCESFRCRQPSVRRSGENVDGVDLAVNSSARCYRTGIFPGIGKQTTLQRRPGSARSNVAELEALGAS